MKNLILFASGLTFGLMSAVIIFAEIAMFTKADSLNFLKHIIDENMGFLTV